MSNRRTRVIAFICAILVLGGFVVFRSQNTSDGAFEQAQQLMKQLRSSAIDSGLSADQVALLKKQKEESELRISTLTTLIEADNVRARKILRSFEVSPTQQQAIINEFTMASPRSYFNAQYANVLGTALSTKTDLKSVLTSINIAINDRNLREAYITDYNGFAQNYCTTDDPSVDITKKGTVKFPLSSRADAVDTCESNVLVQYQCNSQKFADTVKTTCPNGCSNGVCQDTPAIVFSGFTLTLPTTAPINTPVNLSITAVKSDNSTDTGYNKSVIILIDGDPQATLPLTAQTLSGGTLSLPGSLTFKSAGTKTVIVKDVASGIETRKIIEVSASGSTPTTPSTPTCPQLSPPPADFCKNGTAVDGGKNAAGCQLPPTCIANPAPACTGTLPSHAITVMGVGTTSRGWTYDSSPTGPYQSCTFKCQLGYLYQGGSCVATQITQPGSGSGLGSTIVNPPLVICPLPAAPLCTDGTLVDGGKDANGCSKAPTCVKNTITCPTYTAPVTGFCSGGQIIDGGMDANGCQKPATCGPKLITGPVTVEGVKDCWFGDATKQITLGNLLSYQATPTSNSGIRYLDEILLYGATAPTATSVLTNILSYEDSLWTAADGSTPSNATQLTNFFIFRTNSDGNRTWNIPAGTKFYGCFARGDRPNTW